MPRLDASDKKKLLRTMLLSRMGDLREQSLIRQGRGWFHVSGMGHEALAVAGYLLQDGDFFAGYYRDRPIALARGISSYELALAFFAKRNSASGGRQMPAHYSDRERGILSIASVVAASLLPATGMAWALQIDRRPNVVLTTVGDAGTREGDFFEAAAFALEKNLPVVFLVEDNGIGISTATSHTHPLALGLLNRAQWSVFDGCHVDEVFQAVQPALHAARSGEGPQFLWCRTERISSHSSADDHRKYRSDSELQSLADKDPLNRLRGDLLENQILSASEFAKIEESIKEEVRREYQRAWEEVDPEPADLLKHVLGPAVNAPALPIRNLGEQCRMVDAINATFHAAMDSIPGTVFFGQDIADPKGGVFSLTHGLSTKDPRRAVNSPLAESTIIGTAAGMAAYGKRPVFEIQFVDFFWPGFNQLVTQLSTLHWRSCGEWSAPAVIYAPYGAYLPGGAIWHSQSNESVFAHFPGLQVAVPSTPGDAAGLFWSAFHALSPSIILIPKHLMWNSHAVPDSLEPVPFGKAVIRRSGDSLTVVTYGNGTEVVDKALHDFSQAEGVEVIDLRSIVPLDLRTVAGSVARTGRLLVVQEDGESCSVGQNLIARITGDRDVFAGLRAPPALVAKPDVNIGYNPALEYAALPSPQQVQDKMRELLANDARPRSERPSVTQPAPTATAHRKFTESMADHSPDSASPESFPITVPTLGEGITSASVASLLKNPGDPVQADDSLCELETDKALFPVESPHKGTLLRWLVAIDDEVEVGRRIAELSLSTDCTRSTDSPPEPSPSCPESTPEPRRGGLPAHVVASLRDVVPAHLSVRARWEPVRKARALAKEKNPQSAPSPTAFAAFAILKAMKRHPLFCSTVLPDGSLAEQDPFDMGIAVALKEDALDTAVIPKASELSAPAFFEAYRNAVAEVRAGRSRSKAAVPLILTSMGRFEVLDAQPLVVPPAIATVFLGCAHQAPAADGTMVPTVNLCLSFDHRWLNGAAAAAFMADVRQFLEAEQPVSPSP